MTTEPVTDGTTIAERLRACYHEFAPAELKVVEDLLGNYPMAGMVSITELSTHTGVSAPTVMRTLKRIGFTSFPAFQRTLKAELEATLSSPVVKHNRWAGAVPQEHVLNEVAGTALENIGSTLKQLDNAAFDAVVERLADTGHAVHLVGGRITHSLADYLHTHLEVMRDAVFLLPDSAALWPHHLLKCHTGDVLLVFDVRRYEADLRKLAELAAARGVIVVLLTDQWLSPIARYARFTFPVRIEARGGWDSAVATLLLIEAFIAGVEKRLWSSLGSRLQELEEIFNHTGRFSRVR